MFDIQEYRGADSDSLRYGRLTASRSSSGKRALWFVPGLGGSVKGAVDFLEQLLPEYDVIYGTDLRGFGLNPLEDPLPSANIIRQDLEAFYQQVIRPANFEELTLCGISLGGILSTLMAAEHPERFRQLILMAPAFSPHAKTFSLAYTVRNTLAFLLKGAKARTQLPYGVTSLTSNPDILNDPQYNAQPPLILTPGLLLSVRALSLQAMAATRKMTIPTMVIIPGQDIVCDPKAMRAAYERIPASTPKVCKEYPDFYHDILFEAGHSHIAQELLTWLASSASRSASLPSR